MRKPWIGARLRFAGVAEGLAGTLALADLVVLPSCRPEPSGHLAAAAQAMGRPVIVTDQGALARYCRPPPAGCAAGPGRRFRPGDRAGAGDGAARRAPRHARPRLRARASAWSRAASACSRSGQEGRGPRPPRRRRQGTP
ncbi:MAG: glycosyltransferase [Geminicoccaceae bacterium]